MEGRERAGRANACRVSDAQIQSVERAIHDADRATDHVYSSILRERSETLRDLLTSARNCGKHRPPSWLATELADLVERECRWLADVALKIAPSEGSS